MRFFSWLWWQIKEFFSFFTEIPSFMLSFLKNFSLNFLDSRKEISPDWWKDKYMFILLSLMAFFFGGIYSLFRLEEACNQFIIDNRLISSKYDTVQSLINSSLNQSILQNIPRPHYSPNFDLFYLTALLFVFFIIFHPRIRKFFIWYVPRLGKSFAIFLWQDTKQTLKFLKSFCNLKNEPLNKEYLEKSGIGFYSWQDLTKVSIKDVLKASWLLFVVIILLFNFGIAYYSSTNEMACHDFIIKNKLTVDLRVPCETIQCLIGNVTINPEQNLTFS
jgi:hypothetical protein